MLSSSSVILVRLCNLLPGLMSPGQDFQCLFLIIGTIVVDVNEEMCALTIWVVDDIEAVSIMKDDLQPRCGQAPWRDWQGMESRTKGSEKSQ